MTTNTAALTSPNPQAGDPPLSPLAAILVLLVIAAVLALLQGASLLVWALKLDLLEGPYRQDLFWQPLTATTTFYLAFMGLGLVSPIVPFMWALMSWAKGYRVLMLPLLFFSAMSFGAAMNGGDILLARYVGHKLGVAKTTCWLPESVECKTELKQQVSPGDPRVWDTDGRLSKWAELEMRSRYPD